MERRTDALYNVTITTPSDKLVSLTGVDYATALAAVENAKQLPDPKLREMIEETERAFGFSGQSSNGYHVSIGATLPRTLTGEKQTCGRRRSEIGPWEQGDNLDEWELIGTDKVCSFCGSLSPDTLLEIVKTLGFGVVEKAKAYKWYVHRDNVPNAGFGGIKYYRQHDTPEFIEQYNTLLRAVSMHA